MSKAVTLTDKERENRAKVAELAHHELRLEGFEQPAEFEAINQAVIDGTLTREQAIAQIKKRYKR